MSAPSNEQRQLVTEILREEPFNCSRVFFFGLREVNHPAPLDNESRLLYERHQELIDSLPLCKVTEDWAGNIVDGPREGARASFFASYRFDHLMVVISKVVEIPAHESRVSSPFNKFFVDAVAASLVPIIGNMADEEQGTRHHELLDERQSAPFNELEAWRQCRTIWRKEFGAETWLAVKDTRLIATGATQEELTGKLRKMDIEPPLLFVPPESEETIYDIISTINVSQ